MSGPNDWKQGSKVWRSGKSARLPPMWPGFKYRRRRHIWVEFVVGSLLCSESFFSGYSGFPLSSKTNIFKFQYDQESGRRRTTLWMCYLLMMIMIMIIIIIKWTIYSGAACILSMMASEPNLQINPTQSTQSLTIVRLTSLKVCTSQTSW